MTANAKDEFLEEVGEKEVLCVCIHTQEYEFDEDGRACKDISKYFNLKTNYTETDFLEFLKQLDFEYYDSFGSQELFGCIWYKDGTWSERGEYDGSEWWEYKIVPEIPKYLR